MNISVIHHVSTMQIAYLYLHHAMQLPHRSERPLACCGVDGIHDRCIVYLILFLLSIDLTIFYLYTYLPTYLPIYIHKYMYIPDNCTLVRYDFRVISIGRFERHEMFAVCILLNLFLYYTFTIFILF